MMQTLEGSSASTSEGTPIRIQFSHLKEEGALGKNTGDSHKLWAFAAALLLTASVAAGITIGVQKHHADRFESLAPAIPATVVHPVQSVAGASSQHDAVSEESAYVQCAFTYKGDEFNRQALLLPSVTDVVNQDDLTKSDGRIVLTNGILYNSTGAPAGYVTFRASVSNRFISNTEKVAMAFETGSFYFTNAADSSISYDTSTLGTTVFPPTGVDLVGNNGRGALLGLTNVNIKASRVGNLRNLLFMLPDRVCNDLQKP
eukprot:g265.t1